MICCPLSIVVNGVNSGNRAPITSATLQADAHDLQVKSIFMFDRTVFEARLAPTAVAVVQTPAPTAFLRAMYGRRTVKMRGSACSAAIRFILARFDAE